MAKKSKTKKLVDDDEWIRLHFEELVDKYGGQYVFVAGGKVFPVASGEDVAKKEEKIRKKYGIAPIGMPVPQPRDFFSILCSR